MASQVIDALGGFEIRPANRLGKLKVSGAGADEGRHVSPTAEPLAEVVAVGPHIEPLGAVDAKADDGGSDFQELIFVDADLAGGAVDRFAFPGQFIEGNAVFFDRRDHGRNLVEFPGELGKGRFDGGAIQRRNGFGLEDLAGGVLSVGGFTQLQGALVLLVLGHEEVLDAGGLADDEHEESGGDRVQGAAMTDLALVKAAANKIDDVMGGFSGWFVDQQETVQLRDHGDELSFKFTITFTGKPEGLNS